MGSPPGDNFAISRQATFKGYGMEICEALVRWFNHTTPKGDIACPAHTVRSMPGIREPAWQEIDIRQHEALFLEILRAESADPWPKPEQKVRQYLEEARARGDRLWTLKEDVYLDDHKEKAENVLWHQVIYKDSECPSEAGVTWLAIADLSDVDRKRSTDLLGASNYAMLLYYKENPYFIGASLGTAFVKSRRFSGTFCNIDNFGVKSERRQK